MLRHNCRYYAGHNLEGLRKITKTYVDDEDDDVKGLGFGVVYTRL
jgi:hypothetical protein